MTDARRRGRATDDRSPRSGSARRASSTRAGRAGAVLAAPALARRAGARPAGRRGGATGGRSTTTRTASPAPRRRSAPARGCATALVHHPRHRHRRRRSSSTAGCCRGANGMAGEFGHMQVVPDGHRCECGDRGCWEQYCSGNALVRDGPRPGRPRCRPLLDELCGGDPARLTGPMVTAGGRGRRPRSPVRRSRRWATGSASGVANLVAAFDPDVVIVGGGVSEAGDRLLEPARAALARSLVGRGYRAVPALVRGHGSGPRPASSAPPTWRGRPLRRSGGSARPARGHRDGPRGARRGLGPPIGAARLGPAELAVHQIRAPSS